MLSSNLFSIICGVILWSQTINAESEITFQNVSVFIGGTLDETICKEVFVKSSANLPDALFPENTHVVVIENQTIPVLYRSSMANLWAFFVCLRNDSIREIRPGAFGSEGRIMMLSLKDNKLQEIKRSIFNYVNIMQLYLDNNEISKIESTAFDSMKSLMIISLRGNKIASWDSEWFSNVPKLSVVHFEHNLIESLDERDLYNLRHSNRNKLIGLSYNKIKNLERFRERGVEKVILSHNNLVELGQNSNSKTLMDNKEMKTISADVNQKTSLNAQETSQHNLTTDSLSFEMFENKRQATLLETPSFAYSDGRSTNETLCQRCIDVDQYKKLDPDIFEEGGIYKIIAFDHNEISTLPGTLYETFGAVKQLYVDHNNIATVHQTFFSNQKYLKTLQLGYNKIKYLKKNTFVDLSSFPDELGLDHNNIVTLENGTFNSLGQIKRLLLDYNDITDYDEKFLGSTSVSVSFLGLSHNKISCLKGDLAKTFSRQENISLHRNPWNCTCLQQLKEWGRTNNNNYLVQLRDFCFIE